MSHLLRSPDGDLIEVPTAVMRVRLKAQGYRDAEPESDGEVEHQDVEDEADLADLLADPFAEREADEG